MKQKLLRTLNISMILITLCVNSLPSSAGPKLRSTDRNISAEREEDTRTVRFRFRGPGDWEASSPCNSPCILATAFLIAGVGVLATGLGNGLNAVRKWGELGNEGQANAIKAMERVRDALHDDHVHKQPVPSKRFTNQQSEHEKVGHDPVAQQPNTNQKTSESGEAKKDT